MTVKTIYEMFDVCFNDSVLNLSISGRDKNGMTQSIISSADAKKYIIQNYATRQYPVILGVSASLLDAKESWQETFTLYLKNHQHGIDKQLQALFDYDYSPIENVDRYETETIEGSETGETSNLQTNNLTNTLSYGKTETNSGTDTTTYGRTVTDSGSDTVTNSGTDTVTNSGTDTLTNSGTDSVSTTGTDSTKKTGTETLTKSGAIINTTEKSGFNAPYAYTPDTKNTESYNNYEEETAYNVTDSTTYGRVETTQHGHVEATQHGHVEATQHGLASETEYGRVETNSGEDVLEHGHIVTLSGSDTDRKTGTVSDASESSGTSETERTLHVHGNIGVTTNNQLIEAELEMRKISLAEMILDDIIDAYTYYS